MSSTYIQQYAPHTWKPWLSEGPFLSQGNGHLIQLQQGEVLGVASKHMSSGCVMKGCSSHSECLLMHACMHLFHKYWTMFLLYDYSTFVWFSIFCFELFCNFACPRTPILKQLSFASFFFAVLHAPYFLQHPTRSSGMPMGCICFPYITFLVPIFSIWTL